MACFFYKFGLIILTWEISPRIFFMQRVWLLSVFRKFKRRDSSSGLKLLIFFSILYWYGVFCCCLWYLSCLFTYETLLKYTDKNCINVILIIYSLFSDVFQLKITLIQVSFAGLKGCKLETFPYNFLRFHYSYIIELLEIIENCSVPKMRLFSKIIDVYFLVCYGLRFQKEKILKIV